MGGVIANCCSTDKDAHEDTSKVVVRSAKPQKKSMTYLIETDKINDPEENHCIGAPSNRDNRPITQKRQSNNDSVALDRGDTEANCDIMAPEKDIDRSRVQLHDDELYPNTQNLGLKLLPREMEQGKRGLMNVQAGFSERELHDVFT